MVVLPQDDASDDTVAPAHEPAQGSQPDEGAAEDDEAPAKADDLDDLDDDGEARDEEDDDDYGPPFENRSFGGEFAWADTPSFTCKILRVKPGENVIVSTKGRKDMHAMLTGGRALLEIHGDADSDQIELLPAAPIQIEPGKDYRLVAITEVELFTVYAPL